MSFVISNCNYCRAKNIRLDNKGFNKLSAYQWDILAICSNCNYPTVYRLIQKTGIEFPFNEQLKVATKLEDLKNLNLNLFFSIGSIIVPPNRELVVCPEYVPENIKTVFDEAAICLSNNCYTASGAMFRQRWLRKFEQLL